MEQLQRNRRHRLPTPRSRRRWPSLALAVALASTPPSGLLAAPGALPDLGDSSEATLSRTAERTLGSQAMHSLRAQGGYLDDPEVNDYLQNLGQRLVAADPSIGEHFEFFALGSSAINAFALPGGHVGVNTGLILAAQSESELASVLAHEISHVTQHHIARQYAAQANAGYASIAALLVAILAGARGNGDVGSAAIAGVTAAQMQSQITFTREHEHEADRLGFALLDRAGFDASAMASFFERLQQATRIVDGNTPAWLRTHPLTQQRIAESYDRALDKPYRQIRDSTEFHMVRALLRSYEGEPRDAVARLSAELEQGSYRDRNAARYGLAAGQLRARDFDRAWSQVSVLERDGARHPMIEALAAQILQQSGRLDEARARHEAALARYPGHLQLVYDYPRVLLLSKRYREAAAFAEDRLRRRPGDANLHQLAAEAEAGLGRDLKSHYHQGEYYAALGDMSGALQQFELAVKSRGGDFQDLQVADARLREVREQQRDMKKPGRAPVGFTSGNTALRGFTRD